MRLTRAAFSVLIKFSDGIQSVYTLIEDIDLVMKDFSDENDQKQKLKSTIGVLEERKSEEYKTLLKQWE